MDSSRRLPKVSAHDLLEIVRRIVVSRSPLQHSVRAAVDELILLPPIRYYIQSYTQKQINAFATHASRYFELYHPSGSIEISHTSRYSHRTGKSELCILATRNLSSGTVITELKGSMANLTDEEDRELKRTDLRNSDIRRDFSVIHSKSMKKNHLFLGPARFVNHDCDNNCELFREGKYITFRVLRPISMGEEITAHYGDSYFGRKNRHCLCETCEKKGRGGYAPDHTDDDIPSDSSLSDSEDSDDESDTSSAPEDDVVKRQVNLDERRTRRGVYAVVSKEEDQSDESDDEDGDVVPLAGAVDIPSAGEVEMGDATSDLSSLPSSRAPSNAGPSTVTKVSSTSRSISSLSSLSSDGASPVPKGNAYPSIISTRRQKAEATRLSSSTPVQDDSASSSRRLTRSSSSVTPSQVTPSKGKGKQKEQSSCSTPTPQKPNNKVKEEDLRTLRTRPVAASDLVKEGSSKADVLRGPDGKPLPLCATCHNILPVISVDHKIVWGLGLEKESKKKKAKQDCPRCMRHYAIYGESWPRRSPLPGCTSTLNPTPREETTPIDSSRKVTHKVLPVLDRKIAAVASSKRKSVEAEAEEEHDRPAKKFKVDINPAKKRKRKRGRPRLRPLSPPPVKVEDKDEEEPLHPQGFKSQGRRMNGRFERTVSSSASPQKGYDPDSPQNASVNRAQRALEREKAKQLLEREILAKRGLSDGEIDRIAKNGRLGDHQPPLRKVFPKRSTSFRTHNLFSRPTPMNFAARAWANSVMSDDGSSDDDKGPVTPEDSQSPPAIIEVEMEEWDRGPSLIVTAPAIPPAYKPSPFSFARRRWSSLSTSPVEEQSKPSGEARLPRGMERILGKGRDSSNSIPLLTNRFMGHSLDEEDPFSYAFQGGVKRPLLLQHTYPSDVTYTQESVTNLSFAPPSFIAPNFANPGWESDLSDS
ncbi:hypothetical protein BDP27DRAFT_1331052 [Rhodocollybia butyracea]|uniref:SET domain-containing protein n=1 Tax=Rhodocollybia butyracea TaxID=206335 RepID=A0A9P5PMX8_9AGAR|nr:hypothetical protein BDP27DRAFT_1331052 [Rhodocollybia butyracea]